MKTLSDYIYSLLVIAFLIVLARVLTSCTLQVSPDGTRTWGIDGEQAARAIIIYTK